MTSSDNKSKIFIVYASNEEPLAAALKGLLEHWSFETFYCRQKEREATPGEGL